MKEWLFIIGGISVVLLLYLIKTVVLKHVQDRRLASRYFLLAVACCIPVVWAISPDWNNMHVAYIANIIGTPMFVLSVPVLSFYYDLNSRAEGAQKSRFWRIPFELFVLVPLWAAFWEFLEIFVFRWIWI